MIPDSLVGKIDTLLTHYSRAMEYGRHLDSLIIYFQDAHKIYIAAVILFGSLAIICFIILCRLWICNQRNRHLHIVTCLLRTIHKLNAITTTKK